MNWRNFWKSTYTIHLEDELATLRASVGRTIGDMEARHIAQLIQFNERRVDELARVESLNQTIQFEAMRERTELKRAHAEELSRVIEENQKLRDDLERVRLLITPALQSVELPKERTEPPKPNLFTETGTPWQREQRRWANHLRELEAREKQPTVTVPEGEPNGSVREGRVEAPLGKPS